MRKPTLSFDNSPSGFAKIRQKQNLAEVNLGLCPVQCGNSKSRVTVVVAVNVSPFSTFLSVVGV